MDLAAGLARMNIQSNTEAARKDTNEVSRAVNPSRTAKAQNVAGFSAMVEASSTHVGVGRFVETSSSSTVVPENVAESQRQTLNDDLNLNLMARIELLDSRITELLKERNELVAMRGSNILSVRNASVQAITVIGPSPDSAISPFASSVPESLSGGKKEPDEIAKLSQDVDDMSSNASREIVSNEAGKTELNDVQAVDTADKRLTVRNGDDLETLVREWADGDENDTGD